MMGDLKHGRLGSETIGPPWPFTRFRPSLWLGPFRRESSPAALAWRARLLVLTGLEVTGFSGLGPHTWDLSPSGQQSLVLFNVCFWNAYWEVTSALTVNINTCTLP